VLVLVNGSVLVLVNGSVHISCRAAPHQPSPAHLRRIRTGWWSRYSRYSCGSLSSSLLCSSFRRAESGDRLSRLPCIAPPCCYTATSHNRPCAHRSQLYIASAATAERTEPRPRRLVLVPASDDWGGWAGRELGRVGMAHCYRRPGRGGSTLLIPICFSSLSSRPLLLLSPPPRCPAPPPPPPRRRRRLANRW
jgi:hypothetical protein